MTRRPWTAAALAALTLIGGCGPHWKTYAEPAHGFSANYPLKPKPSQKQDGGFVLEAGRGSNDYAVTVTCDPTTERTPEELVQAGVDLWRGQGNILSQTNVAAGQAAGRELRVGKPDAPTAAVRLFAAHKCLYQVLAVSSKGPSDPIVAQFLNSFRLTG